MYPRAPAGGLILPRNVSTVRVAVKTPPADLARHMEKDPMHCQDHRQMGSAETCNFIVLKGL